MFHTINCCDNIKVMLQWYVDLVEYVVYAVRQWLNGYSG